MGSFHVPNIDHVTVEYGFQLMLAIGMSNELQMTEKQLSGERMKLDNVETFGEMSKLIRIMEFQNSSLKVKRTLNSASFLRYSRIFNI